MDSLLQHFNSTTTPPHDPLYEIHQLIQKYSQNPSFTSPLATKLQKTYEQVPIEKIRSEINSRKALQKRRQRTDSETISSSLVSIEHYFTIHGRNRHVYHIIKSLLQEHSPRSYVRCPPENWFLLGTSKDSISPKNQLVKTIGPALLTCHRQRSRKIRQWTLPHGLQKSRPKSTIYHSSQKNWMMPSKDAPNKIYRHFMLIWLIL